MIEPPHSSNVGKDLRFVYDGWNVIEVLDGLGANAGVKKYTWGFDLRGLSGNGVASVSNRWSGVAPAVSPLSGIHGAEGIGGLLVVEETAATGSPAYWFLYDANGNVGQVIKASDQSIAARYEYDPYGHPITVAGTYGPTNPFRFSTKWHDHELGKEFSDDGEGPYYYGYRYYSPRLGRWISRDPIAERGGHNTYGFNHNNLSLFDALGACPSVNHGQDVMFSNVMMEPGDNYWRWEPLRELTANFQFAAYVSRKIVGKGCCPAVGVVQIVRHKKGDEMEWGGWQLDWVALSGGRPFYPYSTPFPPAESTQVTEEDNPGWDPGGIWDTATEHSFRMEFESCIVCAVPKYSINWVGCPLGCVTWSFSYVWRGKRALVPQHNVKIRINDQEVWGLPNESPRSPRLYLTHVVPREATGTWTNIVRPYFIGNAP